LLYSVSAIVVDLSNYRTTTKTRKGPFRGAFCFWSFDDFRFKG